jgi:hypothetical protein
VILRVLRNGTTHPRLFRDSPHILEIATLMPDLPEKVMDVLPKRFAKYGLTLHPEKTRRWSSDDVQWERQNGRSKT